MRWKGRVQVQIAFITTPFFSRSYCFPISHGSFVRTSNILQLHRICKYLYVWLRAPLLFLFPLASSVCSFVWVQFLFEFEREILKKESSCISSPKSSCSILFNGMDFTEGSDEETHWQAPPCGSSKGHWMLDFVLEINLKAGRNMISSFAILHSTIWLK